MKLMKAMDKAFHTSSLVVGRHLENVSGINQSFRCPNDKNENKEYMNCPPWTMNACVELSHLFGIAFRCLLRLGCTVTLHRMDGKSSKANYFVLGLPSDVTDHKNMHIAYFNSHPTNLNVDRDCWTNETQRQKQLEVYGEVNSMIERATGKECGLHQCLLACEEAKYYTSIAFEEEEDCKKRLVSTLCTQLNEEVGNGVDYAFSVEANDIDGIDVVRKYIENNINDIKTLFPFINCCKDVTFRQAHYLMVGRGGKKSGALKHLAADVNGSLTGSDGNGIASLSTLDEYKGGLSGEALEQFNGQLAKHGGDGTKLLKKVQKIRREWESSKLKLQNDLQTVALILFRRFGDIRKLITINADEIEIKEERQLYYDVLSNYDNNSFSELSNAIVKAIELKQIMPMLKGHITQQPDIIKANALSKEELKHLANAAAGGGYDLRKLYNNNRELYVEMFEDAEARSLFATLLKKCDDAVDLTTKVYFVDFDSNKQSAKRMRKSRWAVSVYGKEKLGITIDQYITDKMKVVSVDEGTPFDHTGLKKGDIITHINSNKVHNVKAGIELMKDARKGTGACIIIFTIS